MLEPEHTHIWNTVKPEDWARSFATIPGLENVPYQHDAVRHEEFLNFADNIWMSTAASLPGFVAGCWLGWLSSTESFGSSAKARLEGLLALPVKCLVGLMALSIISPYTYTLQTESTKGLIGLLFFPFVSLVYAAVLYQMFWSTSVFTTLITGNRLVQWLSKITYSAYLFHITLVFIIVLSLPPEYTGLENIVWVPWLALLMSFALFWPLHYLVECPVLWLYGGGRRSSLPKSKRS